MWDFAHRKPALRKGITAAVPPLLCGLGLGRRLLPCVVQRAVTARQGLSDSVPIAHVPRSPSGNIVKRLQDKPPGAVSFLSTARGET